MINNEVKKFKCFGEGWATRAGVNVDFSKLDWGKGATLNVAHIGIVDPLFGDTESDLPWYDDVDFVIYLLSQKPEYINNFIEAVKSTVENKNIKATVENLNNIVRFVIEESNYDVRKFFEVLGVCKGCALCGVVDDDYFAQLVIDSGLEIDDDYIFITELG